MPEQAWIPIAIVVALAMEPWARFAHGVLWHGPLLPVHRSHHQPSGALEANDLFAVLHALPAALLVIYGSVDPGPHGVVAFGIGVGMTAFGAAYGLVHDGLIHGRLPVGFLGRFRWLARIRGAHRAHHATGGPPYGLFLGPQELAAWSRAKVAERCRPPETPSP